jgi:hypothetical protein
MVIPHSNDPTVDFTEFLHEGTVRVVVAAHAALRRADEELPSSIV